ncbi:Receptor Mediated Endocytosis family member [Echinococcus multilocularis]|uniref:Receptor Mediated Endocytosis family member n=1 Tax=Echinococcus multilocularis TaxID=6211 RepID=A0A068Y8S1_ECHMU|nr:Receptor Mediated Endocytosis family member [Echinococcus multilocularis]
MEGLFSASKKAKDQGVYRTVIDGLHSLYFKYLLPLETTYRFHEFHSPPLEHADFDSTPIVLLVGQYSTGKTTFIRYLIGEDFPGMRIGPEPTTDKFIAIMHGEQSSIIPGNALVVDPKKQFRPLSAFGNNFLNRFQCSLLNNKVLEGISLVDTPGILSGEKQRLGRGYDLTGVIEWFAHHVDRIILLFDAHKLDISDEFKSVIEAVKGNEDKVRIVLNKADMVDFQQLMRVYGALMWNLGKILGTPEVARVYIGSFWDHQLHFDTNRRLFELEQADLFQDLQSLPAYSTIRKLNDLIRRARLAKVHAYIVSELRRQMPALIGKETKKKELIANLPAIYENLSRTHHISIGDFPSIDRMRELLAAQDFKSFSNLQPKLIAGVEKMLSVDIAKLMQMIPQEQKVGSEAFRPQVEGGAFDNFETPFGFGASEGINRGKFESTWVVELEVPEAFEIFRTLDTADGKISGETARVEMLKSQLPAATLRRIWTLCDIDKDGCLTMDEFALAKYLIKLKLNGHELPSTLPDHLYPPSMQSYRLTHDGTSGVNAESSSIHSIPLSSKNGDI